MSRSRKKHPVVWWARRSNKTGKRQANKRFRRIVRQRINSDLGGLNHLSEMQELGDGQRIIGIIRTQSQFDEWMREMGLIERN